MDRMPPPPIMEICSPSPLRASTGSEGGEEHISDEEDHLPDYPTSFTAAAASRLSETMFVSSTTPRKVKGWELRAERKRLHQILPPTVAVAIPSLSMFSVSRYGEDGRGGGAFRPGPR
ncbi:hypothetical protein ACUV84_023167 [Puccinellia chinampoensis]